MRENAVRVAALKAFVIVATKNDQSNDFYEKFLRFGYSKKIAVF